MKKASMSSLIFCSLSLMAANVYGKEQANPPSAAPKDAKAMDQHDHKAGEGHPHPHGYGPGQHGHPEGHPHKGVEMIFKMMDSNGDGKITDAEHIAGASMMFSKMDGNSDKKVTAAEMDQMPAHLGMKKPDPAKLKSAEKIAMVDTNGDGVISSEEHVAGSKKMFSKMDGNSDGNLTMDEVQKGHAEMLHQMKKP